MISLCSTWGGGGESVGACRIYKDPKSRPKVLVQSTLADCVPSTCFPEWFALLHEPCKSHVIPMSFNNGNCSEFFYICTCVTESMGVLCITMKKCALKRRLHSVYKIRKKDDKM